MQHNQILVTYGTDPFSMTIELLEQANLADLIPPGASIGIKPNLVLAKPAQSGATTSPAIVSALIEYLKEHGKNDLLILESSWIGEKTSRSVSACGYDALCKQYGVPFLDIKQDCYTTLSYDGLEMKISQTALSLDFLINVPVLKGHCQTQITCALKNLKGCLPDSEKRHFHSLGLHRPIAYLNRLLPQHFVLVDGMCGDLDFEEGGNPVQMNRILCGIDPVLVDSYVATEMGYAPQEIEYLNIAQAIGVGSTDLSQADIAVLHRDHTPVSPSPSFRVQRLSRATRQDSACSACYANLIRALCRLDDEGRFSHYLENPIRIGQGYRGKSLEGIGVGNCTQGCSYHVAGCPPTAEAIYRALVRR